VTYSTVSEVRLAIAPAGTTGPNTPAGLSDAQILDAIAQADQKIDQYLGGRYLTPIASVGTDTDGSPMYPAPIEMWSRALAAFYATLTFYQNRPMAADDPARLRYADVLADLTAARDGKSLLLGIPSVPDPGDSAQTGYAVVLDGPSSVLFDGYDSTTYPRRPWGYLPGGF
jgi:phage gp36-like protein